MRSNRTLLRDGNRSRNAFTGHGARDGDRLPPRRQRPGFLGKSLQSFFGVGKLTLCNRGRGPGAFIWERSANALFQLLGLLTCFNGSYFGAATSMLAEWPLAGF